MERAGLDEAGFYRAITGTESRPGDGGMVTNAGTPKPTWWWVFRAWRAMQGIRLETSGAEADAGLWARATRGSRGCISVLLANFVATGSPSRTVTIDLEGRLPACPSGRVTTIATLDGGPTTFDAPTPAVLHGQRATVEMDPRSVALVRSSCGQRR